MRTSGLIDLQVNGYAGVDFNDAGLTADAMDHALRAMLEAGVTTCLPTLITAPEAALAAWRSIGGTGWCVVAMYLAMVWTGLEYSKAAAEGRDLTDPPPGYGADGRPAA